MKTKFTESQLLKHSPCSDGLDFAKSLKFDFVKIYEQCDHGDWLIWLLQKSGNLDKPKAVELAIACAEHVLEIFEKKYPKDKRPRKAIAAAIAWLKNPTESNRKAASDAAPYAPYAPYNAAYNAPYASDAAYAAAAYADSDAYNAAYNAAYAAVYAAVYAAYDAYVLKTERKWQADTIRKLIPNPFVVQEQ